MSRPCIGILSSVVAALLLQGCTTLRPEDDKRADIAQEAAEAAQALRQQDSSPFSTLAHSSQTLAQSWQQVTELQAQDRQTTFYADLGNLTREELRQEFMLALQVHLMSLRGARQQVDAAAAAVRADLARQQRLTRLMGTDGGDDLDSVLQEIERRIEWLRGLQVKISKILTAGQAVRSSIDGTSATGSQADSTAGTSAGDATPGSHTDDAGGLLPAGTDQRLLAVEDFLSEVQKDPRVQASGELLLRSGQQVATIERQRLEELKTYLQSLRLSLGRLESRQADYFQLLAIPTMGVILTADEFWSTLDTIKAALAGTCPQDFDPRANPTLPLLSEAALAAGTPHPEASTPPSAVDVVACQIDDLKALKPQWNHYLDSHQALWAEHGTLLSFVQESLKTTTSSSPLFGSPATVASRMVPQLALLLFVEEPADAQAELEIATLRHQHALRLSQINADERLALVEQVAQAMQIYYQGGLSPSEVSEAILLASQVVATAFIGTRL